MNDPIVVVPHSPRWKHRFRELETQLCAALGPLARRIEHVGSTAVPGLWAKPIVDVDVVIAEDADLARVARCLARQGYEHVGDQGIEGRKAFRLREEPLQGKDHHLYVCRENAEELRRHLAFRGHLIANPHQAAAYGELKRTLARRFRADREAYTSAKTVFITEVLEEAESRTMAHSGSRSSRAPAP